MPACIRILDESLPSLIVDRNLRTWCDRGITQSTPALTDELRWSEARYRTLATATTQIIIWAGPPEGGVAEVSNNWTAITGHPKEAALGLGFLDLMPPEDRERFIGPWRRALDAADEFQAEFRLRHADGHFLHMLSRSVPVCDDAGKVRERIGTLTDLTAEKLADSARRASEERFTNAFSRSALPMSIRELGGGPLIDINHAWVALTGYAREEALGSTGADIKWLDPADVDRITQRFRAGVRVEGEPARLWRKSGERLDVLIWTEEIELAGRRCILSSVQDVTERLRAEANLRASEELFQKAFELSPIAMTIRDRGDGLRLIRANQAYFELTGYTPDELIGQRMDESPLYEDTSRLRARVQAMQQTGAPLRDVETQLRRKSGDMAIVLLRSEVIEVGGRSCALTTLSDMTPRVDAERALAATEARLRHSQKLEALGQLAGGIAHDFNNLLTVVIGYGERMLEIEDGRDSELRENAEQIVKAGHRAAALTRQLLAFSRRQRLEPRLIDLNTIVLDIEKMLRRVIGERITIVTTLEAGLGSTFADPGQIEQVMMNLAINARDSMPNGGTLTIVTANVDCTESEAERRGLKPGPYVTLTMTDTGVGMDEYTQAHVFEPFFTTKETGKGTGLGLSTVYGIVMQTGGAIGIDSAPGRGTSMRVFLPRSNTKAGEDAATSIGAQPTGRETILLVEDDDGVRPLMTSLLESVGYRVISAANGEAALRAAHDSRTPIDLVVTDVVMPGMNGVELTTRLREFLPNIRALYVSGYTATSDLRPTALEPGTHFLQKPFTRPILTQKVREALDVRPATERKNL